jgi:regulator of sigma D
MQKLATEGIDFSSNIEDLKAKFEKDIKKGKKITHDIISDYVREELAKTEQVLKEKFKLEDKEIDVLGDKNFDIGVRVNQSTEGLR